MKVVLRDASLVPKTDWARLASFIDGEGNIYIARQTRRQKGVRSSVHHCYIVELRISNTDPRLIDWLIVTFGGGRKCQQKKMQNPKWKTIYHWVIAGSNAVFLLGNCYEFLLLKREQADIAFAHQKLVLRRGEVTPPENVQKREQLKRKLHLLTMRGKEVVNG